MMTMPYTERSRRTTLLYVAAATWLLLISAAVVIDHVVLSTLAEEAEDRAPGMQVAVLEARLAELARELEQHRQGPAALPLVRYESERLALDQRLAALEKALGDRPTTDLQSLQTRIDRLTQSILAKAFRGELVPQEPNDEPASLLLERIKAQRAAAPKARQRRKV